MAEKAKLVLRDAIEQLRNFESSLHDSYDEIEALYEKWSKDACEKHSESIFAKTTEFLSELIKTGKVLFETKDKLLYENSIPTILKDVNKTLNGALQEAMQARIKIANMTAVECENNYYTSPAEYLYEGWGKVIEDDCCDLNMELLCLENNFFRQLLELGNSDVNKPSVGYMYMTKGDLEDLTDTERNILKALGAQTLIGRELLNLAGYDNSSHYRQILSNLRKRSILGRNAKGYYAIRQISCQ